MDIAWEADAGRNNAAETSDVLNVVEYCQPCKEQDNEKQAVYWCTNCPELLCENCHSHHKVLKATRGHKMLNVGDYHIIGTSIAEFESHCQTHPPMEIQFVCVTHNAPCCATCKEKNHATGCDVQIKENILKKADIRGNMNATISAMTKMIENMRSVLRNDHLNASDLEKQKALYYAEMKNGRQRVEQFLDEFENNAREKFESAFYVTNKALRDNTSKIEHILNVVQKRTDTAERIKESGFSELQMYLVNNKFHQVNLKEEMIINSLFEEIKHVFIAAIPVYNLNPETNQITLNNGLDVGVIEHSQISHKEIADDEIEVSSSTVEAEEDNFDEKGILLQDNSSSDDESTNATLPDDYNLNEHFFIARRNKDIYIRCARFLQNDRIVLTENSDCRLLVYKTNGFKVGQVKFEDGPDEIAVINENRVAVSVDKKIVFVDITDMKIEHKKNLRDFIQGLSYANKKLFACLQHRGIHIMGLSGNIIQTIPYIKGNLYICSTIDDMIYSVTHGSFKTLQCYNIDERKTDMYSVTCSSCANGISCDTNGNIFIAGSDSSVYRFNTTTKSFSIILDKYNGIENPCSVDCCDNGNTILMIDGGKELKIFKKGNLNSKMVLPTFSSCI